VKRLPAAAPERLTYAALLVLTGGAWAHTVWMAGRHDMAAMGGGGFSPGGAAAYVLGWGVMMTAMMLPSALPMIGLYAVTARSREGAGGLPVALFAGIYLGLWAASGLPMYLASLGWEALPPGPRASCTAAVLILTGLFQLSPLKQACLARCRSPISFLLGRWRPGWRGGLALGGAHAGYCLGCCWALMVVLVAVGAMGLSWVLLVGALVAAEKVLPRGEWIARAAGLALAALGVAVALRPDLAAWLRGPSPAM
jgi:predicted metal-binding membrane protein